MLVTLIFFTIGSLAFFLRNAVIPFLGGYSLLVFNPLSVVSVSLITLIFLSDIKQRKKRGELGVIFPNENYLLLTSIFFFIIGVSIYLGLFGLELYNLLIGLIFYTGSMLFTYILVRIHNIRK